MTKHEMWQIYCKHEDMIDMTVDTESGPFSAVSKTAKVITQEEMMRELNDAPTQENL